MKHYYNDKIPKYFTTNKFIYIYILMILILVLVCIYIYINETLLILYRNLFQTFNWQYINLLLMHIYIDIGMTYLDACTS